MKSTPKGHIRLRGFGGLNAEQRRDAETLRFLGTEFRIFADECRDPYLPCARGAQVFVWGRNRIAAQLNTRNRTATMKALAQACPTVREQQVGDIELIVSVDISEGRALALHMKARKASPTRVLSDEERKRLLAVSGLLRNRETPTVEERSCGAKIKNSPSPRPKGPTGQSGAFSPLYPDGVSTDDGDAVPDALDRSSPDMEGLSQEGTA